MLRLFLIFSEIEPHDYYIDNIELHFVKSQEENISFFKVNVKLKLDPFLHVHHFNFRHAEQYYQSRNVSDATSADESSDESDVF